MLGEFCYFLLVISTFTTATYVEQLESGKTQDLPTSRKSANVSVVVESTTKTKLNFSTPSAALMDSRDSFNASTAESDFTHRGRENVSDNSPLKNITSDKTSSSTMISTTITYNKTLLIPPAESSPKYDVISEKNDGKPIVPKKGVIYKSTTQNENRNIDPTAATKSAESSVNQMKNDTQKLNVHRSDNEEQNNIRSNFTLPIIGIIVSVPLVGILFMVFYKHGAEWWQHRHYRRMDFLIDGMYNN